MSIQAGEGAETNVMKNVAMGVNGTITIAGITTGIDKYCEKKQ